MSVYSTGDSVGPVLAWVYDPGDDPTLTRVLTVADELSKLIREVANDVLPDAGVRWTVESISMASPLRLELRPVPSRSTGATLGDLGRVTEAITGGMTQLERASIRPPFFSDAALERAKALAKEAAGDSRMTFGSGRPGEEAIEITGQFITHVDEILGRTLTEIGSVEGRLEAFNVHGSNRYFNVYDDLTGERIRCDFGQRIEVAEIGAAAERRVSVQGEITVRETGDIVRVKAHSLTVFPPSAELPTAEDVLGILGG